MEATDLKMGDWVLYKDKEPVKIVELGLAMCSICDKDGDIYGEFYYDVDNDYFTPIPLTEEILEKNGWKKQDKEYINEEDGLSIKITRGLYMVSLIVGEDRILLNDYEYVHQLQHLLWALGLDDNLKI